MDGVLGIDKPSGPTSHDIVARARHILDHARIGHTGTLDPFATGLLVLLVGRATRLAQFLTGLEKEYLAVIRLGYATDTGDVTGKPITTSPAQDEKAIWTNEQINAALDSLRGEIEQVPPMYSAKKQAGRKLYELARAGKEVERKPVRIRIFEFEATPHGGQWLKDNLDGTFDLEVRVVCSAGTYVRTLAEDFGKQLNVGAHLAELRRTRVGDFLISNAKTLDQVKISVAEESIGSILQKPDEALSRLPFVDLTDDEVQKVRNGVNIARAEDAWNEGERVRLRGRNSNLIAVGVFDSVSGVLHPDVVMALD
jgi:tRNA pseudouridine55 synthase